MSRIDDIRAAARKLNRPWECEPDVLRWTDAETGYGCLIQRCSIGTLEGFVCLPYGHPCYGEHHAFLSRVLQPHRGVSRSGGNTGGYWWFGLEFCHPGDFVPAFPWEQGTYRRIDYVERCVMLLASALYDEQEWCELVARAVGG